MFRPDCSASADISEKELEAELDVARPLARFHHLAKREVREIPVRIGELRMIPCVVKLSSKFRIEPLADSSSLLNR